MIAKRKTAPPESITYASSGFGGVLHLRAEMLAQVLGARFVHVPYRTGAQMVTAIMKGEAQFGIAALATATPSCARARCVRRHGGRAPLQPFPDIPTLDEIGVPASTMAASSC